MIPLNKSYKNRKVSLTIHCKYKYLDSTVQRAEDRRQKFAVCRLPFAVNVKLNLSIVLPLENQIHISNIPYVFRFGHIRRWDISVPSTFCILNSADPGLLKIRRSHRFVAEVIQFLIPLTGELLGKSNKLRESDLRWISILSRVSRNTSSRFMLQKPG